MKYPMLLVPAVLFGTISGLTIWRPEMMIRLETSMPWPWGVIARRRFSARGLEPQSEAAYIEYRAISVVIFVIMLLLFIAAFTG